MMEGTPRRVMLGAAILASAVVFTGGFEPAAPPWTPIPAASVPVPPAASSTALPAPQPQTPPTRVRIPAIRVDSPLETLDLDGAGALRPPRDFAKAGWYAAGTAPGDVGPAVIAGHVDSRQGPAVFFRLHQLKPGDTIQVARGERWLGFRVVATDRYPKNRFPTEAVYGPTPDPQLRLITCGGVFDSDRRSYVDNVVVYATPE
jgi:LPXTG-site transpeptidase (sortase) family protein